MEPRATHPAEKAPEFWECPTCNYLSDDPSFASKGAPCPGCGSAAGPRRLFPPDSQRLLDQRIRHYYGDGEWQITVILAAALLEALLEDILDRIMAAHGADIAIRRTLLDSVRAIGVRISRLFPDLTGVEFDEAASAAGFGDFPKRWRKMRESRNAFIHDTPYRDVEGTLDRPAATESMLLLDSAYTLFVSLNNKFVADGRHRKQAGPHVSLHGDVAGEDTADGAVGT
jgi:AcrR family transcriptional regulator